MFICWVFIVHRGYFLVVVHRLLIAAASGFCCAVHGLQACGLQSCGSQALSAGSVFGAQEFSCSSACEIFSDFPGKSWKPLKRKKWFGVNYIYRRSLFLILKYISARNEELWAPLERNREMAGTVGCQAPVNAGTRRFFFVPSVSKSPQTRVEFCVCLISL